MFLFNSINVIIITLLCLITTFNNCKLLSASELHHHVYCNKNFISVALPLTSNYSDLFIKRVYWHNLHSNLVEECQPLYHAHEITFGILLKNVFKCGFQRAVNKWKDQVSFYQDLIIEENLYVTTKINIKCAYKVKVGPHKLKHKVIKRSTLPADFQEDADIEILDTIEQNAPVPEILMEVRQNGDVIDGMVTIIPGTPLTMEIKLNNMANDIYGINVNYLQVTDMAEMSETILFRGCTVDPYLFENFNLTQSNSLKSKFRAFKFPNTAFVQFRTNVQICLKKCKTPECIGNSATKNLRRRREIDRKQEHFYEINTSFLLKFNESFKDNSAELLKLRSHVDLLHIKNLHLKNVSS